MVNDPRLGAIRIEKVAGVVLVEKLRAILLMEARYIFFNKWVFGFKAIDRLYLDNYIPYDQYSQRENTAEDARLDSRPTYDISCQLKFPMATVSVDADKCYDRINHIIMSLLLLLLVGVTGLVTALLHLIQSTRFYQRTAFGDSKTFMGGRDGGNPLQGLCQGNGAVPACWLMIGKTGKNCSLNFFYIYRRHLMGFCFYECLPSKTAVKRCPPKKYYYLILLTFFHLFYVVLT